MLPLRKRNISIIQLTQMSTGHIWSLDKIFKTNNFSFLDNRNQSNAWNNTWMRKILLFVHNKVRNNFVMCLLWDTARFIFILFFYGSTRRNWDFLYFELGSCYIWENKTYKSICYFWFICLRKSLLLVHTNQNCQHLILRSSYFLFFGWGLTLE